MLFHFKHTVSLSPILRTERKILSIIAGKTLSHKIEAQTLKLHLLYSILDGIILGVLALNEFVFLKSMGGSDIHIGILFQFSMLVFVGLVLINEWLRRIDNKKRLLRLTALVCRLPLLLLLLFPSSFQDTTSQHLYHILFLTIFFVYYLASPIIYPTINQLLKNAYCHQHFGLLYARVGAVNKVIMLVTTFAYGWALDRMPQLYIYVLPAMAPIAITAIFLLSNIPYQQTIASPKMPFLKSVKQGIRRMHIMLFGNRAYLHFEIGFMFYGFAFMSTIALITIYFDNVLQLNYSSVAFYKNAYNVLAIALMPYFGKLIGKIDPRRFAAITFSAMLLYLFFLAISQQLPYYFMLFNIKIYYTMLFYILAHGVFAATMALLWNIGSAYFGKKESAGDLQAIHLSLTGARAVFAPLLGIYLYQQLGFSISFGIAILSLGIGVLLMLWSQRTTTLQLTN